MRRLKPVALLVLAVLYVALAAGPAWKRVNEVAHARDYATFHYAVAQAVGTEDGGRGDPYRTAALSKRAREEGTREAVHPFFYPPPALLPMLWVSPPGQTPLPLAAGYRAWFFIQQIFLVGVFVGLWRWVRAPVVLLGVLAVTFTPIPDNLKMGQFNLPVLFLVVLGLQHRAGLLIGAAGMTKMSPALYLVGWAAQRRWRPVLVAVATAMGLSLLALPLVPLDTQLRFYTEILPGFGSGHYNGLQVPISLPANHSIPDLFDQLWPGPSEHELDPRARVASQALSLGLLGTLLPLLRRRTDALGQASAFGALTALMLVAPVYTYEHHLVMLLLPLVAVAESLRRGRLSRRWLWLMAPTYFLLAWPLRWLRSVSEWLPELAWLLQESKFAAIVSLGVVSAVAAWRAPVEQTAA